MSQCAQHGAKLFRSYYEGKYYPTLPQTAQVLHRGKFGSVGGVTDRGQRAANACTAGKVRGHACRGCAGPHLNGNKGTFPGIAQYKCREKSE